jgi:hypothetical protein
MGAPSETPINISLLSIIAIGGVIRPVARPPIIIIARCRTFMRVVMVVAESTVVSAVLSAALKPLVMSALMRIRQLIMELSVTPIPSIFIIMGQRRNDWNTQK